MEYPNNLFLSIFLNATILVVWFLTNAYYEYISKVIPSAFVSYESFIKDNHFLYYTDYLEKKNAFISKLFSCPFCLGFWSSLGCSIIYNIVFYICVIYIVSLILFFGIKYICCKN